MRILISVLLALACLLVVDTSLAGGMRFQGHNIGSHSHMSRGGFGFHSGSGFGFHNGGGFGFHHRHHFNHHRGFHGSKFVFSNRFHSSSFRFNKFRRFDNFTVIGTPRFITKHGVRPKVVQIRTFDPRVNGFVVRDFRW